MREAPLAVISKDYRQRMTHDNLDAVIAALRSQVSTPTPDVVKMCAELRAECVLRDEFESFRKSHEAGALIRNDKTRAVHRSAIDGLSVPPLKWKTRCGLEFGRFPFTRLTALPSDQRQWCERCFAAELAQRKVEVVSDQDEYPSVPDRIDCAMEPASHSDPCVSGGGRCE